MRKKSTLTMLGIAFMVGMLLCSASWFNSSALAQSKQINWKGVGTHTAGSQWEGFWKWLEKELPKRTNGQLTMNAVTLPELGLTGFELVRVLRPGLVDIADVVTGYVSGDLPIIEGVQLPGVYKTYEQARQGYKAWAPVYEAQQTAMGGRPISSYAFCSLYLLAREPINSLQDLKGKKIRVFAKSQSDYLVALGAEPVSLPVSEIYTALERGTVDGCVTGIDYASNNKLYEVTKYLVDIQLGVGAGLRVVSQRSWDKLPAEIQKMFIASGSEFTDRGWDLGQKDNEQCLKDVIKHGMNVIIPAKPEWVPILDAAAKNKVIPGWKDRAGSKGVKAFNEYLAPIVGFKISQ